MTYKSLFRAFKNSGMEVDVEFTFGVMDGSAVCVFETERTPPYTEAGLRRWADYCRMVAEMFGDTANQFEYGTSII